MLFNSEKFNFKYEGYELSERKFRRNEEAMLKNFLKMKREFSELNKKHSGKTMSASLFGKKSLTTNEATRHSQLKDVANFIETYGKIKEELSEVMTKVMKNFSIGQYSTPQFAGDFDNVITKVQELRKTVVGSVTGGKKRKKRTTKSKALRKKSSKSKKTKKVKKKVVRRRRTAFLGVF
jgi:hypothetical protein